jgi:predicted SprT family Zn-dependent metalloprotease
MLKQNKPTQKLTSKILSPINIELLPIHKNLQVVTNEFLQKYSLDACGWKLEWEKSKKYLGKCYFHHKTITLSVYWSLYLPAEETKDTILHEIAHALTWEQFNRDKVEISPAFWKKMSNDYLKHGVIWQMFCKQVGAKPIACYDGEVKLPTVK